jgi:hypothetical protein
MTRERYAFPTGRQVNCYPRRYPRGSFTQYWPGKRILPPGITSHAVARSASKLSYARPLQSDVPFTPRDRPLKIQRKNSGSGNKCLRAIGTTTRSLRNWVRSAKNLNFDCRLI